MSGPIVRRYGFANFEKIFGTREIPHGSDAPESEQGSAEESPGTGLPPDLSTRPIDPNRSSSGGTIAPSTEFGNAAD